MAFSDTQTRQLRAKLDEKYVKTRIADGTTLHYVEGWHAIAEANRIFGYDAWDRRTLNARCVWTSNSGARFQAAYIAKVRIRVRAGDLTITRDGSGTGEGSAFTAGQAHDIALKSAETDATKRALTTFGNAFGLALYDAEQSGVRRRGAKLAKAGPWLLHANDASEKAFSATADFAQALKDELSSAPDIEKLFDLWERNVTVVRSLSRCGKRGEGADLARALVDHFKSCARSHAKSPDAPAAEAGQVERSKIDKSVLTIGEPKRIRSKEHLRYVASQPCLICGRSPAHAHHLRFAQAKGLGLKVSDEFTVPLCAIHHHDMHKTAREREWWQERKIDPLIVARELWRESRTRADGANDVSSRPSTALPDSAGSIEAPKSTEPKAGVAPEAQ
jgi:DNA recombination protein Rad52